MWIFQLRSICLILNDKSIHNVDVFDSFTFLLRNDVYVYWNCNVEVFLLKCYSKMLHSNMILKCNIEDSVTLKCNYTRMYAQNVASNSVLHWSVWY